MKHISFKAIISTWAIFLFFAPLIQAQTSPAVFLQKNKTSDLVFEGEVISQITEYSSDKATILTKSTVRISKIFKGVLRDGVCEVVTPGGTADDRFVIYGKALQLSTDDKGLFGSKRSQYPLTITEFLSLMNIGQWSSLIFFPPGQSTPTNKMAESL